MGKREAKKRIEKLKKVINYHRYLYHVENRQEISEEALDSLKHELYQLEQKYPEFITPDSPTQRVAGEPLEGFKKIQHRVPMLSIEDVFSEQELEDWQNYLERMSPGQDWDYFTEPKIDGFAVTLIYKDGIFSKAGTRGNGKTGEDVTQNVKTIESVPLRLKIHESDRSGLPKEIRANIRDSIEEGEIEIRGEVYMEKDDFEKLNQAMREKGEQTFANPRNLAAGSIRQLSPQLAASRPLKFFAYDIISNVGQSTHSQEHLILSAIGFRTDQGKECQNVSEVMDYYHQIEEKREGFPFQIDGVVVTVNQNSLFSKFGVVGKSPRGVRALKFPPKKATTKVKDIKLQIGRTGAVTPVAELEPVEISGVMISRATLHNEDEIRRLGVKTGDTVIVGRSGDVIPVVFKVLSELRTGKEKDFSMPKKCPACGTGLVKPEGEAVWRCPNPDCFARRRKHFYHFVSKGAFDIEGLGPKIVDKLIEEGLVSDPADLFSLKEGDLLPLEGFASKAAQNLVDSIQAKKEISLSRFIYALGIRNVGEETSYLLANRFGSLGALKKASKGQLEDIRDIGPVVAESIYNFFHQERSLKFIKKIKEYGVSIRNPSEGKSQNLSLENLTFVFTGSLQSMVRKDAQDKVRKLGGKVSSSVSDRTDYVVAGENPGSKIKEARKRGVKVIQESEFLRMIK